MSDSRTDLPSPNSPNFEQRVREALMTYMGRTGNPMDRGLTLRDLLDNGFVTLPAGYTLRPGGQLPPLVPGTTILNPELDLTPPPQPTGFQVASAISHVFLEHDAPLYLQGGGHLRTRVYGVTMNPGDPLPVFGDAVEITQFSGTVHAHPSNPATTWRLWIKWETQAGVLSPTPAGGTNGLPVTTAQDVSLLLEALNGQITESQLDAALEGRVDLIDGGVGVAGSVNSRIQAEVDARILSLSAEAIARQLADSALSSAQGLLSSDIRNTAGSLLTEASARQIADSAIQGAVDRTGVAVGQANASIAEERNQRVEGDTSTASLVTSLTASQAETAAALQVEQSVRAGADSAQAAQTITLAALAQGSAAALTVEQQVRSDEDSALSSQTTTLAAATGANAAALQVEQQARSDEDSALASQTTTLAAATGANAAALQVEQQARSDEDSALASQTTTLAAATGANAAALQVEQQARSNQDSALSSQTTTLAAATGANAAALQVEQQARSDQDSALSSQTTTLAAATGTNAAALVTQAQVSTDADNAQAGQLTVLTAATANTTAGLFSEQSARASSESAQAGSVAGLAVASKDNSAGLLTEQQARAGADSAQASQVFALAAAMGGNSAAITSEATVRAAENSAIVNQVTTLSAVANAKSTTYKQRTVPSNPSVGDIWVDEGSTNLLTYSEQFDNAAWSKTRSSITANAIAAPDGTLTADKLVEDTTATNSHYAVQSSNLTAGTVYTATVYAKAGERTKIALQNANVANWTSQTYAIYDLTTGVITNLFGSNGITGCSMSSVGNGWWRCSFTLTFGPANAAGGLIVHLTDGTTTLYTGNGTSGAYIWGAQLEANSDAGRYIETTATSVSTLDNNSTLRWNGNTWELADNVQLGQLSAALQTESLVRASETGALASQVTTLQAVSKADETALEIEAFVRTLETETLLGQYTVKIDTNGYVTGFGLASEKVDGRVVSSFGVRADRFFIASPSGPGIAPTMPFVVQTTPTVIGGVNVDPGVYITDAFILNGTITNAKIANLAIDSEKVSSISVSKLIAGSIAVGQYIESTGYISGSAGWRIDGGGNAEFSNVTVRGNVVGSTITGGTITGSVITGATIQTAASGQRIQMDTSGLLFLTGTVSGKYGTFKYGTSRKYGAGVLVYFNNATKRVPFYVAAEQNVADIHLYNRGADPTGATYEAGDMICVNGRLKIYVPALGGWKTLALDP